MKCFTAQQSRTAASELGEMDCGPGDHPREPHSRPKQRAQTRCSLAAAVRLRVVSENEMVHTFVATMRPVGGSDGCAQHTLRHGLSRNRLLERRDSVWQGRRLPRCRSAATDRGACRTQNPETPRPAGRAGHEHPAEGRGNSSDLTIQSFP